MSAFLESALITALEGGSNYWYLLTKESEEKLWAIQKTADTALCPAECFVRGILNGELFDILDVETDENLGVIDLASCHKAIELMCADGHTQRVTNIVNEQFDCWDADVFFQFAVMGELVYG